MNPDTPVIQTHHECTWSPLHEDACGFCSGEQCGFCGAGMSQIGQPDGEPCEHDAEQRHRYWGWTAHVSQEVLPARGLSS